MQLYRIAELIVTFWFLPSFKKLGFWVAPLKFPIGSFSNDDGEGEGEAF